MSFPRFYERKRVGQLFVPRADAAFSEGVGLGLPQADEDDLRVLLLLVDTQVDFVHTDGALSVPGAVEDTQRTIEWIFRHVDRLTAIAASLDSHVPLQIFYPTWWLNEAGEHPVPYTAITSDDVKAGKWLPLYQKEWSVAYVEKLAVQAKKDLMIWPYHTMIGTPGHAITPALYEAVAYHAAARQAQPIFLSKGSIPETEHYSIMEPEVKVPEKEGGMLNTQFLDLLGTYDLVYVAGQAKSHCVLETVTSMMRYFSQDIISKLRVLLDCTSSVAHPEIDFDALANAALDEFAEQGLSLVKTSDPVG